MGKKLRNVMLHTMAIVMAATLVFANILCVFAEDTGSGETTEVVSDAEMTPNSEKLVSQKAPETVPANFTLNKTDVLGSLLGAEHLFYDGDFSGKFVVNTEPYLEIRYEANADSEVAGKIYPASFGVVEEWGPEWTKVSSGNVEGYISTKDIHIGYDAEKVAKEVGDHKATVTVESLNIRQEADANSDVVATAIESEAFPVVESGEEWTRINFGDGEGFVAKEFIDETIELDEALTIAEEEAGEVVASVKEEQEAVAAEQAPATEQSSEESVAGSNEEANPETSNSTPVYASSDDAYLLACMVYVESGAESYEGQLAVANVIMNRVRNERFDDTIAEVIYAPGQFPGAHNGVLDGVLASGPSESCMRAAQEALAGVNNIGDYYYFNGYVDTSSVGSYTVIGGHTFYNY